ncbi:hypothetical protein P4O66_003212 [Electrophorus voltai]|uniref:Uncharacterized protein n=1 Tax=Electrophorus voltai TaxID=2609070 RepID=A0AAD8YU92_9TELE|nr:hypothetical protein P4O66_003212 [Electrophorus voltai]
MFSESSEITCESKGRETELSQEYWMGPPKSQEVDCIWGSPWAAGNRWTVVWSSMSGSGADVPLCMSSRVKDTPPAPALSKHRPTKDAWEGEQKKDGEERKQMPFHNPCSEILRHPGLTPYSHNMGEDNWWILGGALGMVQGRTLQSSKDLSRSTGAIS